ncbi:transmembrane protein, putative (macronuclear) [Tetrahymena thermophila SB210]|uniref:Transmembrane protein, putative n=1 Tax=Tetrahymena thermophila (strain SB210) TaxID=312017 RepID=I7MB46_TETTS|nr:transmembrane protein, putative [Tetrahymena thermophila SB210]EAS07638.1 transmembrane protein, putative [Tetrahymena thermophila SB210]|eukprot:XP_001027880.1 transmembrane protein, putative [Tetrahymena thermophila SB210]
MDQQKTTFQDELSQFDIMLNEFENEQEIQMKGVLLGQLHKKYKSICQLIEKEISTIDMRRMRSALNPKYEKLKLLEKELLIEADLFFFQNLLKDFKVKSCKFYQVKGTQEEMSACFKKFFIILNSISDLRQIKPENQNLVSRVQNLFKEYGDEIKKFQQKFQMDIKAFQQQEQERQNKDKKNQNQSFSSQDSAEDIDEEEVSQIPTILNQGKHKKNNGSVLENIHLSNDNPEEDQHQLQELKQQLQQELIQKQKQYLMTEEQIQKEIQEEINQICQDINTINAMMSEIARLAHSQDQHFESLEQQTEQTLQNVIEAEKDLQIASQEQVKYRKKVFSLSGAALGGGLGFFVGGPIGSALGATVGTTIGSVVGSASSKKTF